MQIPQPILLAACRKLTKIIPSKPVKPGLACIHATSDWSGTRLRATNLETEIEIGIPRAQPIGKLAKALAKPIEPETFLIPAATLLNCAISAEKDSNVTITAESIQIQIGNTLSDVPWESQDLEFPDPIPFQADYDSCELDASAVKRCFKCVAEKKALRPAIEGVFWQGNSLVGCDGQRLHMEQVSSQCPEAAGISIPQPIAALMEEGMNISFNASHIHLVSNTENVITRITSAALATKYPNWVGIIPDPSENRLQIASDTTLNTLRKLLKTEKPENIAIIPEGDSITLQTENTLIRDRAITTGRPTPFRVEPRYLIDALENGGDTIQRDANSYAIRITGFRKNLHIIQLRHHEPIPA
jgi:DNA polymerase III sliding clamp (beta) subunit (PCNA family)